MIPFYDPPIDSSRKIKKQERKKKKLTVRQRLEDIRSLQVDTTYALMTINSFSKAHLKTFFKSSFRKLRKDSVKNLVIDIRANGGGDINNYILLTKFLRKSSFKVADTVFAKSKSFRPFTRYISAGFFENIGLFFLTHKERDGKYHFGFWERHTFTPKRRNDFNGGVYVLTNGLTFSAASLFCNAITGRQNVTILG